MLDCFQTDLNGGLANAVGIWAVFWTAVGRLYSRVTAAERSGIRLNLRFIIGEGRAACPPPPSLPSPNPSLSPRCSGKSHKGRSSGWLEPKCHRLSVVDISGFKRPPLVWKSKQSVGFQAACSYSATSTAANTE